MSLRVKILLTCTLLALSLFCTVYAARAALGAFESFQQESKLTRQGDIHTIRAWMTIPYIARVYRVPEGYLYRTLRVSDGLGVHHATLETLAARIHRPVGDLISQVQRAILLYRKQHPPPSPSAQVESKFAGGKRD